jgi:sec-independent protein translocase protein TatA
MPFGPEVLIVVGVIVLLFGGSKLPGLARSLGSAKQEFEAAAKARPAEPVTAPAAAALAPATVAVVTEPETQPVHDAA